MASSKPKSSGDKSAGERSAGVGPVTIANRRTDTQHQLDQLRSVLANDLPETERAIVLWRYKIVCQEAVNLGMDVDCHVRLRGLR
jgi:hypothetical protein